MVSLLAKSWVYLSSSIAIKTTVGLRKYSRTIQPKLPVLRNTTIEGMSLLLSADLFKSIGSAKVRNDDIYDRLNRRYSVFVLGILLVVVTSSQLVGKPLNIISCWCPAEFTGEMVKYANSLCWSKSTYYIPEERSLPLRDQRRPPHISYYQWVPFILLIQIFLFYLPGFLWRNLNKFSSIDSKSIMFQVMKLDVADSKRAEKVKSIVNQFDRALNHQRGLSKRTFKSANGFFNLNTHHFHHKNSNPSSIRRRTLLYRLLPSVIFDKGSGHFLVSLYLFIKLLYVINAIGQLFLLNSFLGYEFSFEGIHHLQGFIRKNPMLTRSTGSSIRFPIVTICDFSVRGLGDHTRGYTVQCTLPINIFNDKIFLIIFYWLLFVSVMTVYGLLRFIFAAANSRRRLAFVDKHLNIDANEEDRIDENEIAFFAEEYCRPDGILTLMLIENNMDEILVGEIVFLLWQQYRNEADRFFSLNSRNGNIDNA
ncbi:hypothetical protein GJ496_004645 [Pomphorhynchus laevis]|nr:hypothetical protein GJ496_004645 [Pomphorhynchus laevis]